MRNLPSRLCVRFVAFVSLVLSGAGCARQAAPPAAPASRPAVERIVAVGDVHGDYGRFVKTLRAADVIDEKDNWIAGKARLVQIGDVLDRGPDSRKAMDLLMKLERQAARAGGAVHALIGNHEAMVCMDDWRYVHPDEPKAFGGPAAYRRAMSAAGKYGKWIRSLDTVLKLDDTLFVHAGLTAAYADLSAAEINKAVRAELDSGDFNGVVGDPDGPLWTRALALGPDEAVGRQLDVVVKAHGAKRMVIGHTVERRGVVARAAGRLIRIDVGMSAFYGGPAACLVIEKGVLYEVRAGGTKRRLPLDAPAEKAVNAP